MPGRALAELALSRCAGRRYCMYRGWPAGCMLGDGAHDSASFDPQHVRAPFCDVICIRSISKLICLLIIPPPSQMTYLYIMIELKINSSNISLIYQNLHENKNFVICYGHHKFVWNTSILLFFKSASRSISEIRKNTNHSNASKHLILLIILSIFLQEVQMRNSGPEINYFLLSLYLWRKDKIYIAEATYYIVT